MAEEVLCGYALILVIMIANACKVFLKFKICKKIH